MKTTRTFPTIVLSTVLLAAVLGGCRKEDSGQGGAGDGAQITSRTEGEGQGSAAGVAGATGNSAVPGLGAVEYNNNITPRTVGEHARGDRENVPGAIGGASGFSGGEAVGPNGGTTGGANPGGAPMAPAPQEGTKATGHTGDTTGTGPVSTRKGEATPSVRADQRPGSGLRRPAAGAVQGGFENPPYANDPVPYCAPRTQKNAPSVGWARCAHALRAWPVVAGTDMSLAQRAMDANRAELEAGGRSAPANAGSMRT